MIQGRTGRRWEYKDTQGCAFLITAGLAGSVLLLLLLLLSEDDCSTVIYPASPPSSLSLSLPSYTLAYQNFILLVVARVPRMEPRSSPSLCDLEVRGIWPNKAGK
uniref:Uncharacterized protein n=1 Tax=Anopheles atroparvus TaxID=41427 RepID=A0A182JIH7_ANOAO